MSTLLLASFATTVVTILLVGVSLLLIGLVLIQKNRGSGLSGAFGGVGGNTAFGTKTGDVLTVITVGFTALFLILSVVGVYVFVPTKIEAKPPASLIPDSGDSSSPTEGAPAADSTGGAAPAEKPSGSPTGSETAPPPAAPPVTPPSTPADSTSPGGN